jgi:hypothetical protein
MVAVYVKETQESRSKGRAREVVVRWIWECLWLSLDRGQAGGGMHGGVAGPCLWLCRVAPPTQFTMSTGSKQPRTLCNQSTLLVSLS